MNKPVTWIQDGEIDEDAGDFGGDIQVGPAISVRFRSDERPDARFEVIAYATAKEWADVSVGDAPDCPHNREIVERYGDGLTARFAPMPAEHIACTHTPGTVDVQAMYIYRRNGKVVDGVYESDDTDSISHQWVGPDAEYPNDSMVKDIERATKDAKNYIRRYVENIDMYLEWDGVTEPKD